jgi:Flp pilus assembly CpaE family ATPase
MDSFEPPLVITAISDPEFEGLVSSALFTQGWSVVARALDFSELQRALANNSGSKLLVIFSTDLPGATAKDLNEINKVNTLVFGFSDETGSDRGFANISSRPRSPEELLLVILENIRATSSRAPLIHAPLNISAQVIAVGGVRHSTGATTFAINLAQEFALSGSRTLLIDGNFQAPALATLLDLRHLATEPKWREVASFFSVLELTQDKLGNFDDLIKEAGECFEKIVLDLGSVTHLASEISDRRWSAKMKIWASRNADDFCLASNSELLSQKALKEFSQSAGKLSLLPKLNLIKIQSAFKQSLTSNKVDFGLPKFQYSWSLPWDPRSCQLAITERTTLSQVAERGALRKEIYAIAHALGAKSAK